MHILGTSPTVVPRMNLSFQHKVCFKKTKISRLLGQHWPYHPRVGWTFVTIIFCVTNFVFLVVSRHHPSSVMCLHSRMHFPTLMTAYYRDRTVNFSVDHGQPHGQVGPRKSFSQTIHLFNDSRHSFVSFETVKLKWFRGNCSPCHGTLPYRATSLTSWVWPFREKIPPPFTSISGELQFVVKNHKNSTASEIES